MATRERLVKDYHTNQKLRQEIWRHWQRNYLLSLRERMKWHHQDPKSRIKTAPQVNDVVLLKQFNLPRRRWSYGKISQLLPGSDGAVRAAKVLLPTGREVVRPVNFLYPLECPGPGYPYGDNQGYQSAGRQSPRSTTPNVRPKRKSALEARKKIRELLRKPSRRR